MKKIIKLHKYDANGRQIVNEAGDYVYNTFVYDFAEMGLSRKMMGIKFFELSEKQVENPPSNDLELAIMLSKQYEQRAYEALLMKQIDDNFELYNPNKTIFSEYEIDELGKGQNWEILQEIKADFFQKARIKSSSSIKEFVNLMKPLIELQQNLKAETGETASLSEILEAVQQITNTK